MRAPKCRVCGVEEWQHVCGPLTESKLASAARETVTTRVTKPIAAPVGPMLPSEQRDGVGSIPASGTKSKGGRPKQHGNTAEKQAAYRVRKKVGP